MAFCQCNALKFRFLYFSVVFNSPTAAGHSILWHGFIVSVDGQMSSHPDNIWRQTVLWLEKKWTNELKKLKKKKISLKGASRRTKRDFSYFEIILVKDMLHYLQHSKLGTLDSAYWSKSNVDFKNDLTIFLFILLFIGTVINIQSFDSGYAQDVSVHRFHII